MERPFDFVTFLETIYRVEQPPEAWLAGVLDAATMALGRHGAVVAAYFLDLSNGGFCASGFRASDPALESFWDDWNVHVPLEARRGIHTFAPCGENATLPPPVNVGWLRPHTDENQVMGVNGLDASLRGCVLARFERRRGAAAIPSDEIASWGRIAAHLAAGARIVHALTEREERLLDRPEAILSAGGRVIHAEASATAATALAALRQAVVQADGARTSRGRKDPRAAVESWGALVAGRWSVLDTFDRDGRRYFVARPNDPEAAPERALSKRELQVARAASLGHTNKLIAYELGLAPSTVARLLARARAKLRVRTRVELIHRMRAS